MKDLSAKIYVLIPGLTSKTWLSGGLMIAQKAASLLSQHRPTYLVSYEDREESIPFLNDILPSAAETDIFISTWGPHIRKLLGQLSNRRLIYYAQSPGWQIQLPITVPILCLSRFLMAYWAEQAPYNPTWLLPPVLEADCRNYNWERDIDVLFIRRKSTRYLQNSLVPLLSGQCNVHVVDQFIPRHELFQLYNRSRVYLYSSAPWDSGWVEGFGLQPLEALVCGCHVFSNLHGGLSDYLEPEINAYKLENYSLQHDVARVLHVLDNTPPVDKLHLEYLYNYYSEHQFHQRLQHILPALDTFFEHTDSYPADLPLLSNKPKIPKWRLRLYSVRRSLVRQLQGQLKAFTQ